MQALIYTVGQAAIILERSLFNIKIPIPNLLLLYMISFSEKLLSLATTYPKLKKGVEIVLGIAMNY